jgi:hypothetical protein
VTTAPAVAAPAKQAAPVAPAAKIAPVPAPADSAKKDTAAAKAKKLSPPPKKKIKPAEPAPVKGTEIYGVVEEELRLKPEQNPIRLTGSLWVMPNAVLTISEGCSIVVSREPLHHVKAIDTLPDINRTLITLRVDGSLVCNGLPNSRIQFMPSDPARLLSWKGLEIGPRAHEFTSVSYTDIRGAAYGIRVAGCGPRLHHNILHYNDVGLACRAGAKPIISNNVICYNQSTGIYNSQGTPEIINNIISGNGNNGLVSDDRSKITVEYNCFWDNRDGDLAGVSGLVGPLVQLNKTKRDSCDKFYNLFTDPVFAGSPSHARRLAGDQRTPTDTVAVSDKKLGRQIAADAEKSNLVQTTGKTGKYRPYELSPYSPCIDAGSRDSDYKDWDGTPSDMGIYGAGK